MPLTGKISYSVSTDGKTLILQDESDYVASGTPIGNYTRQIKLWGSKNASGSVLATLNFQGSDLTVEFDLTNDKYFSAQMLWTGSPAEAAVIINFGTTQQEYNSLYEIFSCGCGCESKDEKESARFGFIYLKLAEKSVLAGNSAQFNTNISNSYKWLSK